MLFCKPSLAAEQGEDVVDKNSQEKNPLEMVVANIQQFFDDLQKKDHNKSQDKVMPRCIVQENPDPEDGVDKPQNLLDTSFDTGDISLIADIDDDDVDFMSRDLDTTFDSVDTRIAAPCTDDSSDTMNWLSGNNNHTIMNEKDLTKPSKSSERGYGQFLFSALCLLLVVMAALAVSPPESAR
jgi:hypothetical protein